VTDVVRSQPSCLICLCDYIVFYSVYANVADEHDVGILIGLLGGRELAIALGKIGRKKSEKELVTRALPTKLKMM